MAYPNFSNLQKIYNKQIGLLLANDGLTTRCDFNFGTTNTNLCPNCIYDPSLKKSSGKYRTGGPVPFAQGRPCPYCNGVGYYGIEKIEHGFLAIIWDYKKWFNPPPQIANPNGFIQTICHRDYLPQIRQCKDITVIYNTAGSNPVFRLYGEPNPAGLGDNEYVFCMWELIGNSNAIPISLTPTPTRIIPSVTPTRSPTRTPTSSVTSTPNLTLTPSVTTTNTATPTATNTQTPSITATATPTTTSTNTSTPTNTVTVTSSITGTPTPTSSITATPTNTATVTPTNTNTPTHTTTVTPTASITPTPNIICYSNILTLDINSCLVCESNILSLDLSACI